VLEAGVRASPESLSETKIWIVPLASRIVAKLALPITRFSTMRPPIFTFTGLASSAE